MNVLLDRTLPMKEATPRERETSVDQKTTSETGETGDKLTGPAERLAGVEKAGPRADVPAGGEIAETFTL